MVIGVLLEQTWGDGFMDFWQTGCIKKFTWQARMSSQPHCSCPFRVSTAEKTPLPVLLWKSSYKSYQREDPTYAKTSDLKMTTPIGLSYQLSVKTLYSMIFAHCCAWEGETENQLHFVTNIVVDELHWRILQDGNSRSSKSKYCVLITPKQL